MKLPEYKGIQNLTGIKVAKQSSFEKSEELYRLNSMADAGEDHQDLQALYQNLANANQKNAERNR